MNWDKSLEVHVLWSLYLSLALSDYVLLIYYLPAMHDLHTPLLTSYHVMFCHLVNTFNQRKNGIRNEKGKTLLTKKSH